MSLVSALRTLSPDAICIGPEVYGVAVILLALCLRKGAQVKAESAELCLGAKAGIEDPFLLLSGHSHLHLWSLVGPPTKPLADCLHVERREFESRQGSPLLLQQLLYTADGACHPGGKRIPAMLRCWCKSSGEPCRDSNSLLST